MVYPPKNQMLFAFTDKDTCRQTSQFQLWRQCLSAWYAPSPDIVFRNISLAPLPVEEDRERDAARPPHRTLHQDVGVGRAEPLRARQVGEAAFVEHGAAAAALVTLADHAQELGVAPAVTDHGLSGETSAGHNETLSSLLARSLLILLNILLTRSRWRRGCF